jgi:hypothetical protein
MQLSILRCASVSVLAGCTSLQHLLLEDCRKLTDLAPLTALSQLHTLMLRNIRNLADLKPVAQVRLKRVIQCRCTLWHWDAVDAAYALLYRV